MILDQRDHESAPDSWFPVRLSPALLERLSGDDVSVPDVRTRVDVAIAEKAAALFLPLGDSRGWRAEFGRELNATDDREAFHQARHGLPVIGGKLIEPHRVLVGNARWSISSSEARRRLGERHQRWRLAYRDVASATNRRTLIAALLPPATVSTHTVFCLRTALPIKAQRFLCGMFNSLVVNYLVRLRVTTHVTTAIVERLPIPREEEAGAMFEEVGSLSRTMSRRDDPASGSRLDAIVARLYQLTEEEFRHVLGTFPLIPKQDLEHAMQEFKAL